MYCVITCAKLIQTWTVGSSPQGGVEVYNFTPGSTFIYCLLQLISSWIHSGGEQGWSQQWRRGKLLTELNSVGDKRQRWREGSQMKEGMEETQLQE